MTFPKPPRKSCLSGIADFAISLAQKSAMVFGLFWRVCKIGKHRLQFHMG